MTDDQTRPVETPTETPAPEIADAGSAPDSAAPATAPTMEPVPQRGGASRLRWLVAFGVAGLAIALTFGALLLFGSPAAPEALRYIPGDAVAVAEVRMDLPGDQMENLGTLLAHFPGFADQSTLTDKLDEAFSQFVGMASDGSADYRTEVKPWLNGPLFVGVSVPAGSITDEGADKSVISATTNGAVECATVFDGGAVTHETYQGLDVSVAADGKLACVLDQRFAIVGDPALVRAALDAKAAGTGMDKNAHYSAARAALDGDRLATMYFNGVALGAMMPTGDDLGIPGMSALTGAVPDWIIAGVRAEDDAVVLDAATAPVPAASDGPSFLPMPDAHASVLAGIVPGDSLLFVEAQGAGVAIQNLFIQLREIPDLAEPLQMLEGLGGASGLVGWIQDAGVAVSLHGTTPDIAVFLVAADEASATTRLQSLTSLLGLMGSGGDGITIAETTISGVAVTTATITDASALIPPGAVPGLEDLSGLGTISFSIAARGNTLLLTSGESAMTAILNVAAGGGLADNATFKQATARGLADSGTTLYLAAGAAIDLAKTFLSAEELAMFETEAKPYIDPLEAILITSSMDGAANRSRVVVTVSNP